MRQIKFKAGQAVRIHWLDSRRKTGWQPASVDVPLARIKSVGIVVANDKQKVTITTSLCDGLRGYSESPLSIPWGCIWLAVPIGGHDGTV